MLRWPDSKGAGRRYRRSPSAYKRFRGSGRLFRPFFLRSFLSKRNRRHLPPPWRGMVLAMEIALGGIYGKETVCGCGESSAISMVAGGASVEVLSSLHAASTVSKVNPVRRNFSWAKFNIT